MVGAALAPRTKTRPVRCSGSQWIDVICHEPGDSIRGSASARCKRELTGPLKAARSRLALITPGLCRDYFQALTADRRLWRSHMKTLEAQPSRRASSPVAHPAGPGPPDLLSRFC